MNKIEKQCGFTMAEVLVAMAVLAVGLLGMAGIQVTGLRNNQTAYYRSQATLLAYDLADKMRANRAGVTSGTYVTAVAALPATTPNGSCTTTTGCTTTQMAQNDVAEWQGVLSAVLPLGQGNLVVAGTGYTISLTWDDNKDSTVDGNDPTFQMSFQP